MSRTKSSRCLSTAVDVAMGAPHILVIKGDENMTTHKHQEQIAKSCIADAKRRMGHGWGMLSPDMQWALIAEAVLGVFACQSAETPEQAMSAFRHVEAIREVAYNKHQKANAWYY